MGRGGGKRWKERRGKERDKGCWKRRCLLRRISAQLLIYFRKGQGWKNHRKLKTSIRRRNEVSKPPGKPCSPHVRRDSEEGVGAILPAQCWGTHLLLSFSRPLPLKLPQNNLVLPAVPLRKGWQGKGLGDNEWSSILATEAQDSQMKG